MLMTTVRFEVRGAVRDLFKSRDKAVLLSGAGGTGKTHGALMLTHLDALNYPGSRHLLLRKTLTSLSASTLVTWRKGVIKQALDAGLVSFYGGSSQEPAAFRYVNGSVVVVGGLDKATKLLSTEYDTAFVDEAIETTAEDLDTIDIRLRNGVMPYQQLRMCTNPGPPTHHLKQRCDVGRARMLYSQHEDNPRMWDGRSWTPYGATYLERLDSLTGVRYERMRWGKWVAAEGLIYEDWNDSVHLIEPFPIPGTWPRYIAMDFGFSNPQVIQWWAKDPDGRLYMYREIYMTRRTVDQHARLFLKQCTDTGTKDGKWLEPKPRAVIADHDAEGRVVFERETGLQTRAADKRVKLGIESFQRRLRTAGDGKPRLFIMRSSLCHQPDRVLRDAKKPTCTADEMTGYVWDVKHGEQQETPVKEDDHGCLVGGTLVATGRGPIAIEGVGIGDVVMTRDGWRAVVGAGMTSRSSRVLRVVMSDGSSLVGTPDHPVWVEGIGWRRIDALRYGDIMSSWPQTPSATAASSFAGTPSQRTGPTAATTRPESQTANGASCACTRKSGGPTTGISQTNTRSTTQTSTRSTTSCPTCCASPSPNTKKLTGRGHANDQPLQSTWNSWPRFGLSLLRGTLPPKAERGTASMLRPTSSDTPRSGTSHADSAGSATPPGPQEGPTSSARTTASQLTAELPGLTTSSASVVGAAPSSPSTATRRHEAAPASVLGVFAVSDPEPVYNLTVKDSPEFYANGTLVHNCDAGRYLVMHIDPPSRGRSKLHLPAALGSLQ